MRKVLKVMVILAILGGLVYWYGNRMGWFDNYGPDNLPTAAERQRMDEIERTSAQIAPDAKPGAGVFLKGTLPPKSVDQTTSTTASTTEIVPANATTTP